MARPHIFAPGEYYHLYSRGIEKRNIFVGSHKDIFIFGEKNSQLESDKVGITTPRNLQYVNLKTPKENELTITVRKKATAS